MECRFIYILYYLIYIVYQPYKYIVYYCKRLVKNENCNYLTRTQTGKNSA